MRTPKRLTTFTPLYRQHADKPHKTVNCAICSDELHFPTVEQCASFEGTVTCTNFECMNQDELLDCVAAENAPFIYTAGRIVPNPDFELYNVHLERLVYMEQEAKDAGEW